MRFLSACAAVALLAGCAAPPGRAGPSEITENIPQAAPDGTGRTLFARVCRPAAAGRARVVVINHGASYAADRLAMEPQGCATESARWFLDRGFMVVFPMRRGYGRTGGALDETSGSCEQPEYGAAGLVGAQDIDSVVRWATALPDARKDDAVVVGQSVGGWAVVAYDSVPHPQVSALIAMAPGRGGWAGGRAGENCRPDLLAAAAAAYAPAASTPMLWVFAANDSYYPPDVAIAMAQAYRAAGGKLYLEMLGPYDGEGHALFQGPGGSAVWGSLVERYLASRQPAS